MVLSIYSPNPEPDHLHLKYFRAKLYGWHREMKVNNESQFITVTGITRPMDISSDNRIKSTYLADARIEYSGKGILADKQGPGWLMRIVDFVWPF